MKRFLQRSIRDLPGKLGIRLIPDIFGNPPVIKNHHVRLPLGGYSQADSYSCGMMAGWSVLEFLNPSADLRRFAFDCAPEPVNGTPAYRLRKALRAQGVSVSTDRLSFPMITRHIKAGHPILTAIHLRGDVYHWIAIYGFQSKPKRVYTIGRILPGFSRRCMTWVQLRSRNGPWLSLVARKRRSPRQARNRLLSSPPHSSFHRVAAAEAFVTQPIM